MAALTAAAVAVVGFLAYQASANVPDDLATKPEASASASAPAGEHTAPAPKKDPLAVPAGSGTGKRVVYALADRRVWLVDAKNRATATFRVMPSPVSAVPGTFSVTSRSGSVKGSDGVPIEHVVRFATVNDVTIGFSAATDGSMEEPDPTVKTGGVRMSREDGDAVWRFATVGVKVVVVP
ncbi:MULTISPECIES: hypothetical protein [unclassified Streptomyces]|uniref:hypothetical protein n=1 Tax=unclassified Streptomyces TaxID=2593676 RepID=UPI000DAD39BF|nr:MULTISPECIES: hypothetical protein [unclassified Streptomyces]PZT76162.1 hypothetical protein DNK56_22620 [Streptomyces sp. AC1-42W]PZT79885.1 hypothetical protein DNK55_10070 [Streptomyces sp. AC1-42T]